MNDQRAPTIGNETAPTLDRERSQVEFHGAVVSNDANAAYSTSFSGL
jgi:hypothetical protein